MKKGRPLGRRPRLPLPGRVLRAFQTTQDEGRQGGSAAHTARQAAQLSWAMTQLRTGRPPSTIPRAPCSNRPSLLSEN